MPDQVRHDGSISRRLISGNASQAPELIGSSIEAHDIPHKIDRYRYMKEIWPAKPAFEQGRPEPDHSGDYPEALARILSPPTVPAHLISLNTFFSSKAK
jgi:hypothetical protein